MLTSETFIKCLEHIFPCTGLIFVGAGNGSALNGERFSRVSRLLAIEADELAFSCLARNLQNRTGWTALNALVGEAEAEAIFFAASNPNESGLLNPEALKAVWRNLTCLEVRQQASTALSSVLQNECEAEHYNWLSVDCLPSARILHGLERHIEQFDVIDVRILDQTAGILENGCTKAECDTLLTPLGYQMVFVEEATNPIVQRVLYIRDGRACLEIHIERLNQRHQFENEQLAQAKAAAEKLAAERAQQVEQATTARDEQSKLFTERLAKLQQLEKTNSELDTRQQLMNTELGNQFKKQADELIRVRKFLDSSLKKEVANATKQIEASIALQSYFATGELPNINTERHSWPISPDFALYLIELIELNNYDLIIEFGSGISTVIVAKTLAKMAPKRSGKPPVDFVSFDHLDQFYQQTHSQLEHAGLAEAVQLTLAPLQDWPAPNGNTYPYYACQPTLAALAQKHPVAGLRLLAIVDGPPAATGKHARYPAGPLILQHFAGAQIDILLDDYIRDDEKEIAKLWQDDITATKLTHTTTQRQLEKDACLIAVSHSKEST